ncbi:MAG: putative siderophore transport system permease protein YfiZ [Candidatus Erwinia impunctatus]|nr:putative siderophore transport system permease protein YfiZ [Culicoides impunctatus]
MPPRRHATLLAGFTLLAGVTLAALLHLLTGSRQLSLATLHEALFHYDARNFQHHIIIQLRLIRLAAALLTGAILGIAGAVLQSTLRNPLGEPHLLGLHSGAALAVVSATAIGVISPLAHTFIAALGAGTLFSIVMGLSATGRSGFTPMKVTLCGVAISAFASSLTAAILIFDEQTLLAMQTWLAGDLAGVNWQTIVPAAITALCGLLLTVFITPSLTVLALGDKLAQGLGVSLLRTRLLALFSVTLLCGAAVALAGPIGFIALIVPHLIRRITGDNLSAVVPLAALAGALLMTLADCAARMLFAPQELATGVMTALVGAPVFIFLAARFFR